LAEQVVLKGAEMRRTLLEARARKSLPPVYDEHPIVKAGHIAHPFGIYLDGVAFPREETAVGFWIYDILSDQRWLITVLRKNELGSCCKGWCTVWAVMNAMRWSLESMASGLYPAKNELRQPFGVPALDALAGASLGARGIVIALRADWSELATTLQLPSWQDGVAPCPFCHSGAHDLYAWRGASLAGAPWQRRTPEEYEEACARCEIEVRPSDAQWRQLRARLVYDDAGGRVMALPLQDLGLEEGDRLDPSIDCPDVGEQGFDVIRPDKCVFWRRSRETSSRRRNPLFHVCPLANVGGGDWLHTYSLGVLLRWCGWVVWTLIECNVFGIGIGPAMKWRIKESVKRLNRLFATWYRKQVGDGRKPTNIRGVKRRMLGKNKSSGMRLHGAQSNTYCKFLGSVLLTYADKLRTKYDVDTVLQCQSMVVRWLHVTQQPEHSYRMPAEAAQSIVDAMKVAMRCMEQLGVHMVPKMHLWVHISCDSLRRGAPSVWGTWLDEDLNGTLKGCCVGASHGPRERWPSRVIFDTNAEMERRFGCV
jgi:hypothetical protein